MKDCGTPFNMHPSHRRRIARCWCVTEDTPGNYYKEMCLRDRLDDLSRRFPGSSVWYPSWWPICGRHYGEQTVRWRLYVFFEGLRFYLCARIAYWRTQRIYARGGFVTADGKIMQT